MDRNAVERFSVQARVKLRLSVQSRMARLGIGKGCEPVSVDRAGDTVVLNLPEGMRTELTSQEESNRQRLIAAVGSEGYDNVVEKAAYTWFNRIIAIRYMEVNDFLPTHTRVLSSSTPGKTEPDIVTRCIQISRSLKAREEELRRISELRDADRLDELFNTMLLLQCNALNDILPGLFTIIGYEGLLLDLSYTTLGSVVRDLVDGVPEEDFRDAVQIIGWMYQFYNSELKDEVFAGLKKNVKISKDRIPAATQLFTPDWIVRYMVENSVGRVWLEGHDDPELRAGWRYYLDEAEQEPEVERRLKELRAPRRRTMPTDIKVIDPCMGSGHVLVYAFDVLMRIYESYGYSASDAAELIVTKNLYGLDIDQRAYQLAYFAVMMKARAYDPGILSKGIRPNLHAVPESGIVPEDYLKVYCTNASSIDRSIAQADLGYLIGLFRNGKVCGSLLRPKQLDYGRIRKVLGNLTTTFDFNPEVHERLKDIVDVAEMLSTEYDAVVTNPPYMGSSGMNPDLSAFVKENYKDSKADLFSCFIERCIGFSNESGFTSMITQHSFMFLSSFESLRSKICSRDTIINMAHFGPHAFDQIGGEVVQSVAFVLSSGLIDSYKGTYLRLIDGNGESEKESRFLSGENRFYVKQDRFKEIPGSPLAYWIGNVGFNLFKNVSINQYGIAKDGIQTGNNDLFLRNWYEVDITRTNIMDTYNSPKWFKTAKAGEHRRWFGSFYVLTNFEDNGRDMIDYGHAQVPKHDMTRPAITWNRIGISDLAFRFLPPGFLSNKGGLCFYLNDDENLYELLAFLNSDIAEFELSVLNPSTSFPPGTINSLRVCSVDRIDSQNLSDLSKECVESSSVIWNQLELSWDYNLNIYFKSTVKETVSYFKAVRAHNQTVIANNSVLINKIYNKYCNVSKSDYYDQRDLSLQHKSDIDIVKIIISFSVGCIFGRYSLDKPGLQFAGGDFKPEPQRFMPDPDNIVPINDSEYFDDDIVSRFVEFIRIAFGDEHLEENLRFIADNLGVKGSGTSRDIIRKYFLKDFYKDHLKMYSNLPIYWLFDSGKENGFKALVYMHRYTPDLISRMRSNYLLPMLNRYNEQLKTAEGAVGAKLQSKILEIETYDIAMEKYAAEKVSIDLDDGIKVNYAKFQDIENPGSRKRIDLLHPLK